MPRQQTCQCSNCLRAKTIIKLSAKFLEEVADGYSWYFNFKQYPALTGSYGYALTYAPAGLGLILRTLYKATKNSHLNKVHVKRIKKLLTLFDNFSEMLSQGSNATFTLSFLNTNLPVAIITGIATPILGIPLAYIFKEQANNAEEQLPLLRLEQAPWRQWLGEFLDPLVQACDFGGSAQLLFILLFYFGVNFPNWTNYLPFVMGITYAALVWLVPEIKKFGHALATEVYVFIVLNILANDQYAKIWGDESIPDMTQYITFAVTALLGILPAWQGYKEEAKSRIQGLEFCRARCRQPEIIQDNVVNINSNSNNASSQTTLISINEAKILAEEHSSSNQALTSTPPATFGKFYSFFRTCWDTKPKEPTESAQSTAVITNSSLLNK